MNQIHKKLRVKLISWQILALLLILLIPLTAVEIQKGDRLLEYETPHIGRIFIEKTIDINNKDFKNLANNIEQLKEDERIKGLIVYINSPGGNIVACEKIYDYLLELGERMPVAVIATELVIGGAYIAALGGQRIFALSSTMTGSIGTMIENIDITEMLEKIGIGSELYKSPKLKATPNPFEKPTADVEKAIYQILDDSYQLLINLIMTRRNISKEEILKIANGSYFTAERAIKTGMIDTIGGEREAIEWLQKEKKLSDELEVYDLFAEEIAAPWYYRFYESETLRNKFINIININNLLGIWRNI